MEETKGGREGGPPHCVLRQKPEGGGLVRARTEIPPSNKEKINKEGVIEEGRSSTEPRPPAGRYGTGGIIYQGQGSSRTAGGMVMGETRIEKGTGQTQ